MLHEASYKKKDRKSERPMVFSGTVLQKMNNQSKCYGRSGHLPLLAMEPSKNPLDTVSRGQLVSNGMIGAGGWSNLALGSMSGI